MNIPVHIINKLNILTVCFDGETNGPATVSLVPCVRVRGKFKAGEAKHIAGLNTVKNTLAKAPIVAVVSGKGVITKDAAAGGIVETVTGDPDTFLWTSTDGKISFIRREQLAPFTEEMERLNIHLLYTECLPCIDEGSLNRVAERFRSEHIGRKRMLKPSAESSRLLMFVAKRLRLPVLGVLLLILVANFVLSAHIREQFQVVNVELASLQRSSSASNASNESRKVLVEQFSRQLPLRASRLSDRIAAATPEKIALREISIAPLSKTPEAGKPIVRNERAVVIRGESVGSEAITEFTEALGRLELGTIRLSSVEQDGERAVLIFKIEITL